MFVRKPKYYFNIKTHKVEEGKQSPWNERMGPYKTYDEAARALERARANTARNDALDAAEEE